MLNYVTELRKHFRHNHLLLPFGGDFAYGNAYLNFKTMDSLINYFNSHMQNTNITL